MTYCPPFVNVTDFDRKKVVKVVFFVRAFQKLIWRWLLVFSKKGMESTRAAGTCSNNFKAINSIFCQLLRNIITKQICFDGCSFH